MFLSYQQEFPADLNGIVNAIGKWQASTQRAKLIECREYAEGKNSFIIGVKKMIWSDTQKKLVENPYAPNYKSCYGFYGDMVSQKVNALMSESPIINGMCECERKQIGFALKSAGDKTASQGYSVIYESVNNKYKVFETENCLIYVDDETEKLMALIRYWYVKIDSKLTLYFEIYDNEGITTYTKGADDKEPKQFGKKKYYITRIETSKLSLQLQNVVMSDLPIVIFKNNQAAQPDLTYNIKAKIDMIDLLESGLCNNIEEFSDVWMTANVNGMTEEQAVAVKETWRRTKTLITGGGDGNNSTDIKTIAVPYEARQTAINIFKQELVEDAGTIDFKQITGAATATEINARTYKLKQRVSDFEWFADDACTKIVEIYQEYSGKQFDISITFNKLFIKNNQEIINIANSLYGKISNKAFLKLLQEANIIDDVEQELNEQKSESLSKIDVGDSNGYSTQEN